MYVCIYRVNPYLHVVPNLEFHLFVRAYHRVGVEGVAKQRVLGDGRDSRMAHAAARELFGHSADPLDGLVCEVRLSRQLGEVRRDGLGRARSIRLHREIQNQTKVRVSD